jgi:hypothetical protein
VLLLVPAALLAQISFDPVQLDDGLGLNYFYPHVERAGSEILCTWSSVSDDLVATHGIHTTPEGQLLDRINYQEVPYGTIYCPGSLTLLHPPDGSQPYMVYHS